jgi:hypothetical protein
MVRERMRLEHHRPFSRRRRPLIIAKLRQRELVDAISFSNDYHLLEYSASRSKTESLLVHKVRETSSKLTFGSNACNRHLSWTCNPFQFPPLCHPTACVCFALQSFNRCPYSWDADDTVIVISEIGFPPERTQKYSCR